MSSRKPNIRLKIFRDIGGSPIVIVTLVRKPSSNCPGAEG
jgi:hypothetical protein